MDFSYPSEVEEFRAELRDWLSANLTAELVAARRPPGRDDAAIELLRAWSRTMADAGWAAVSWPREYGGRGATVLEQLVYTEETTRARAPMPLNVIGMNNIAPAIMQYGTEDQKTTLLPRMMRADDIWCQGMSEPEAGSDLAALRTRAVRCAGPQGDDFVVNGQKIWTSLGHRAHWCQLYVRTDPDAPKHQGISCLIVDMTLPGIEVRPLVTLNGDTDFAEVFFHDVRVPADALLGPLNAGWQVATTTLSHERAGAARLYAEMQVRLEEMVDDIAAQSGALDDPVVLRRLGEIAVRIKYLEVLCQRSISATLHGGDPFASASLAKTVWGEIGQDMAALAFDVLGTGGANAAWANYRLTSRSLTIAGGTTQINKNITAQRVLGLPRK
ncbi:acyl-CoA dehydrogenase family protein [Mycobacterium paraense]|uniref:acyl-CoA dehydrogenase family protein n=1 Tax=Mycobacterium paraense TaxID=767916 RepID=UPI000A14E603|nr:acyl-CoA dehydrogenase family protein [Mycobacterium paraense]MCV7443547.1 acyl-CoA dehydrogenase family protein [Mycobacterium paraense]ORW47322.1 acyl-CoA dehydrogenase [Mycobacterium paraense]